MKDFGKMEDTTIAVKSGMENIAALLTTETGAFEIVQCAQCLYIVK